LKNKTYLYAFFLIITLGFVAYLDSPISIINRSISYSAEQPILSEPVSVQPSDKTEIIKKLESAEKDNGYIIETYREYEIKRDKNGKITEEIPTSITETLKYYDYKLN
jgi:hypothetical protein